MVQARIKNIFSRVRDLMLTKENKILMTSRLKIAFVFRIIFIPVNQENQQLYTC